MIYSMNLDGFAVVISIIWMKILKYFKSGDQSSGTTIWCIHIPYGYHRLLGKADFADLLELYAILNS
jgi:hypothetical protein